MKNLAPFVLLILLLPACNKKARDVAWERTYGAGEAYYVKVTSDSGIIACGMSAGKPYLIRLDRNKKTKVDISAELSGRFTSSLYDTSGYIAAGSSGGKMLLMRYSITGKKLWEKTLNPGFTIDHTQLIQIGSNNYLAVGSADPDTIYSGQTGIAFISVDSTGQVLKEQNYLNGFFLAANEASVDNNGNIYLALTRREAGAEPRASVAKLNNSFQRIWETELANNPAFGAAALAIINDGGGTLFIGGRTELPQDGGGTINNSFVASVSVSGALNWKKYPEIVNSAAALLITSAGELTVLNSNCYFLNKLDNASGSDGGRTRMFDECDPKTTDAFAFDFDEDIYGDLVVAGSLNGSFYLAVKSL